MASPSQQVRAIRLYRHGLKNLLSWCIRREVFYTEAPKLREEFEANKHLDDPGQIERALQKGEGKLHEFLHPDPYIVPYRPGGSLYARNPPLPEEIHMHMDFGREGFH